MPSATAELAEEVTRAQSSFSLPPRVKPENVQRRIDAMVANGVPDLVAQKLSIEAETIQVRRDEQEEARLEKPTRPAPSIPKKP